MPHTKLNKKTTALLTQYGKLWDTNFEQNAKEYWTKIWRSINRKQYLKKIELNLAIMQRSRDKHISCDFYNVAALIQGDAYKLKGLYPKNPPQMKAKSAKSGRDEIVALLDAPFVDGLYGETSSTKLHIITAPVEIRTQERVYPMGQYRICLDFNGIPTISTSMRIPAHRTRIINDCHHHHVYKSGSYCGGEAEGPMRKLFSTGLLYEAVAFVFNYLQSPGGHGYVALDYFQPGGSGSAKPFCGNCLHEPVHAEPLIHCKQCKIALCVKCCCAGRKTCPFSGRKTCPFCGKQLPKRKAVKKKTKKKAPPKKPTTPPGISRRQRIANTTYYMPLSTDP